MRNMAEQPDAAKRLQLIAAPVEFTQTTMSPEQLQIAKRANDFYADLARDQAERRKRFMTASSARGVSSKMRDRVAGGATTILVPIGGTEQNGPHMALGKHNVIAHYLAGHVDAEIGRAHV